MTVVLDTNIWVSALISSQGFAAQIVELWQEDKFAVAMSSTLLAELQNTLNYPRIRKLFRQPDKKFNAFLQLVQKLTVWVEPAEELVVITEDPDDDRVLGCAVAAEASFIVSGDQHLLRLGEYDEVVVLSPRSFVELMGLTEG